MACVGILCDSFDVETPSVLVGGEPEMDVRDDCVLRCVPFNFSESVEAAMLRLGLFPPVGTPLNAGDFALLDNFAIDMSEINGAEKENK